MTQPVATGNYVVANGIASSTAFVTAIMDRAPTANDLNFPVQKRWVNSTTGLEYFLLNFTSTGGIIQANWIELTGGITALNELTGNSGGPVSPMAGNINVVGDATTITIVGNPGTSTLTANVILPATAHQVLVGETSSIAGITNSATSGVPLISQGVSADPIFGTAVVAGGGTGNTSFTAYSVICAGTTSTGAFQNVSGVGTAGQVLTSAGAGALPVWASPSTIVSGYVSISFVDSPYSVQATDYFISVNTSGGAITVRLPNAPTTYRTFVIKDRTGNASSNNITVTTVGGVVTIDGSTTYVMTQPYEAITLIFNGTSYEVF